MQIPLVKNCCCGCSLKTGTKIIGWLSVIFLSLSVVLSVVELAGLYHEVANPTPDTEYITEEQLPALTVLTGMYIMNDVAAFVLSIILLVGVYKNKAQLVFSYVVVDLTLVLMTIPTSICAYLVFIPDLYRLLDLVFYLVDLYCTLVVYSFYRELRSTSDLA